MQCTPVGLSVPGVPHPRPPPKPPDPVPTPVGAVHSQEDTTPISALTLMRTKEWMDWLTRETADSPSYRARFPNEYVRIVDGIAHGVPVDYTGDRSQGRDAPNLPTEPEDEERITAIILEDVRQKKKAGPFTRSPFPNLCVSPIGAVHKRNGKLRVIHHLSYPHGGDSINQNVLALTYSLSSVAHAGRAIVMLGRGCLLIKLDVEAAFKQVPVRPGDWPLLGFRWQGKYYYERVLPFGLRSSCRLWELFAAALHWLCEHRLGVTVPSYVIHYVDDFLFVVQATDGSAAAEAMLRDALALCRELGVPMAPAKTEGPITCLTFLGIELDTVAMQMRLPASRLADLRALMVEWESRDTASIKELQSLHGLLNFACTVVRPGVFYLRRIISYIARLNTLMRARGSDGARLDRRGRDAPHPIPDAVRAEIAWWQDFLPRWSGHSLLYDLEWQQAEHIELFTDACGTGYGGAYREEWIAGRWSPAELAASAREKHLSMPFLELRALVLAAATWGAQWGGKKITFRCDCAPVVQMISLRGSKRADASHQLRELTALAGQHGFDFRCEHIPGVANTVADVLSRSGDCPQFRALRPAAPAAQASVPFISLPGAEARW